MNGSSWPGLPARGQRRQRPLAWPRSSDRFLRPRAHLADPSATFALTSFDAEDLTFTLPCRGRQNSPSPCGRSPRRSGLPRARLNHQESLVQQGLDDVGLSQIPLAFGLRPERGLCCHPSLEFNERCRSDGPHQGHLSRR